MRSVQKGLDVERTPVLRKNLAAAVGPRIVLSMKRFGCTFDCAFLCILNPSNLLYAISSSLKWNNVNRDVFYMLSV